jgi:collagen triple helix repeat protein
MFSKLHDRLGTAGFVVAVIALVAALAGTAFAMTGLNKKQKQQVTAIAKKYAGKEGAQGPKGDKGDKGDPGEKGATGEKGANGTNGTNGTSAKATSFTGEKTVGSVTCKEGGLKVASAEPETAVCNGLKGEKGAEGSPWTAGGTLPSGATETGSWSAGGIEQAAHGETLAFGWSIPLTAAPTVHFLKEGEQETTECPGTAANPLATSGSLCIYTVLEMNVGEFNTSGLPATKAGAFGIIPIKAGVSTAIGTFAVKG